MEKLIGVSFVFCIGKLVKYIDHMLESRVEQSLRVKINIVNITIYFISIVLAIVSMSR